MARKKKTEEKKTKENKEKELSLEKKPRKETPEEKSSEGGVMPGSDKERARELSAPEKSKDELNSSRLKEEFGEIKKKHDLIVPLEEYVKAGIHLGTKIISGDMRQYVYRRRADGLAILNTNLVDEKLREAIALLSKFKPDEIILVCKREAGWDAARLLSEITGIRVFTKKFPAGLITNSSLADFFEPSLVVISDPWIDKNAIHDAKILNIPVIGLCDSNNVTKDIGLVVPCNNKSNKTLGLVFYILTEGYCKAKGIPFSAKIPDFTGEEDAESQK